MSANFEKQSFEHSLEFGVKLQDERAAQLAGILRDWENTAPQRLLAQPKLGDLPIGEVTFWQKNTLDNRSIKLNHQADLGKVTADSAERLEAQMPEDKDKHADKVLAHELEYRWTVAAPRLNGQKQEVKKTVEKTVSVEEEFIVKGEDGKPLHDEKGKQVKEKRLVTKQLKEQISYQPPVYQLGKRKVAAVRSPAEFNAAHKLIQQGIAESIVVQE